MIAPHSSEVVFAAIALLGIASTVAMHKRGNRSNVPELEHSTHVKHHRVLASIVANFAALGQPRATSELIAQLDACLAACEPNAKLSSTLDGTELRRSEWQANRCTRDALRHCKQMVKIAKRSRDQDVLEAAILVTENDLPQLESTLDKLVNNMILDRE